MTGFSLVPCAFWLMADSSAMRGYLPVSAALLKSLLNKLRGTALEDDDRPAIDLATDGPTKAAAVVAVAAVKRAMLEIFMVVVLTCICSKGLCQSHGAFLEGEKTLTTLSCWISMVAWLARGSFPRRHSC